MYSKDIVLVKGTKYYYRKHEVSTTTRCVNLQWEADSIYKLLLNWKRYCVNMACTRKQNELFWRYRRVWVNGYLDTCSRKVDIIIKPLNITKLKYRTILDSTFSFKDKLLESVMSFKLFENVCVFNSIMRFIQFIKKLKK